MNNEEGKVNNHSRLHYSLFIVLCSLNHLNLEFMRSKLTFAVRKF
jgi:hypothetical protein